jgi:hypothetical protein
MVLLSWHQFRGQGLRAARIRVIVIPWRQMYPHDSLARGDTVYRGDWHRATTKGL